MPTRVTVAVMAGELPAITEWAGRNGWQVSYDGEHRRGWASVAHPRADRTVHFYFDVNGYPGIPPAWWCGPEPSAADEAFLAAGGGVAADGSVQPLTAEQLTLIRNPEYYPAPAQPQVITSIYHANPVVCAPWNRLAFSLNGGPHGDWSLNDWRSVAGQTQAHTIADMLATLGVHLQGSPGMQG